ncbi:hypothetical protein POM88_001376 [Heracleum sosnowskyi]|uniref:Uncharacterized protein n=1 Tax=Heracleum sosnowskyi TaxID=360622 RepID=A0AAD8JFQ3_9APIA|nr:hypothetical protein POM88_001376 [Heracleum sosnowskyi]
MCYLGLAKEELDGLRNHVTAWVLLTSWVCLKSDVCDDHGVNHGPYRNRKISLNEQKTQMTLWSTARSPLIFGSINKKFSYFTSSSRFQIKNRGPTFQTRSPKNVGRSESVDMQLRSCKELGISYEDLSTMELLLAVILIDVHLCSEPKETS